MVSVHGCQEELDAYGLPMAPSFVTPEFTPAVEYSMRGPFHLVQKHKFMCLEMHESLWSGYYHRLATRGLLILETMTKFRSLSQQKKVSSSR